MSETVIILGAGASKQAGGPLMFEFLDVAESLLRGGQAGSEQQRAAFELVFRGLAALQPVFAKGTLDADNLEAVFAAFEMAKLFDSLPPLTKDEVSALPAALVTVIVRTLEQKIRLPRNDNIPMSAVANYPFPYVAPQPYRDFAKALKAVISSRPDPWRSAAILTFNYDLALDYALTAEEIPVDYCLDDGDSGIDGLHVLKLHGSLNWQRCANCNRIVPWRLRDYLKVFGSEPSQRTSNDYRLEVGQQLWAFAHCPNTPPPQQSDPIIIPPTWNKTNHYEQIRVVWRRAAAHLSEARNIVVVGYSLPPTDEFFRYLYALGTVGPTRLQRFGLIDIDETGTVEKRFRRLLGPLARRRFAYGRSRFSNAISEIVNHISAPD